MRGPGGAFVALTFQTLAGTLMLMVYTSFRWKIINRGYYRSTLWALWPLVALSSLMLPGALRWAGFGLAAACLLLLAAVYSQRPLLEWVSGVACFGASVYLLVASGQGMASDEAWYPYAHVLVGALVMGAVTHGMTLGHWYLNQARLPIDPLKEASYILFGALGLSALLGLVTRGWLLVGAVPGGLFPIAPSSYWWAWALLVAATVVLAVMVHATIVSRSTQSATGLLYIAIVTALGGQFVLDLLAAT